MNKAILEITDGTTTVSLVDKNNGFWLVEWDPSINLYKNGGVFTDPALADFRQLQTKQWATAIETMRLHISTPKADTTAYQLQQLLRLLQKANSFWLTRWQSDPVWVKAQAKCETNPRYCLLVKGEIPEYGNPYRQPFLGKRATIRNISLVLERQHWLENAPGTGTAVAISALEAYDGRNYGNIDSTGTREPTTANEVYVANKRNEANLTDVYVDDGGAFGANLLNAALPQSLLPAVPVTNDAIYFGIDTSLDDSGPFSSLVFDIGTAGSGYTGTWEYWNGAWTAFPLSATRNIQDNTNGGTFPFENTGVNSVNWDQPSDWATTAVNGVTGYWARMRVTGTTVPTPPTQQNRVIYSVVWPYIELQDTVIAGDISALMRARVYNKPDNATSSLLQHQRTIVGLRSLSRGSGYTNIFNLANEQNPTGVTVALSGSLSFASHTVAPSGIRTVWNPAGVETGAITVKFTSAYGKNLYGRHRVFLRGTQSGGSADETSVYIQYGIVGAILYTSETLTFKDTGGDLFELLDFGEVNIGGTLLPDDQYINDMAFVINISTASGSPPDGYFYDLILIPIDEWAIDSEAVDLTNSTTDSLRNGYNLDIDSIHPKKRIHSQIRDDSTDYVKIGWRKEVNSPVIAQANAQQRYYFLFAHSDGTLPGSWLSHPAMGASVQLTRNQRYLALRGDR